MGIIGEAELKSEGGCWRILEMGFGSRDEDDEDPSDSRDMEEEEEGSAVEWFPKGERESGVSEEECWRAERECWLLNGLVMVLAGLNIWFEAICSFWLLMLFPFLLVLSPKEPFWLLFVFCGGVMIAGLS